MCSDRGVQKSFQQFFQDYLGVLVVAQIQAVLILQVAKQILVDFKISDQRKDAYDQTEGMYYLKNWITEVVLCFEFIVKKFSLNFLVN